MGPLTRDGSSLERDDDIAALEPGPGGRRVLDDLHDDDAEPLADAVPPGVVASEKGAWLATSPTGQTISALVPTDRRADLGKGACYNDVGVEVAFADIGGWDHHTKIFEAYRGNHMKNLDQGLAALIGDLDERLHLRHAEARRHSRRTPAARTDAEGVRVRADIPAADRRRGTGHRVGLQQLARGAERARGISGPVLARMVERMGFVAR